MNEFLLILLVYIKKALLKIKRAFRISVRQKGFEPLTDGLENRCSIQLSYWRLSFRLNKSSTLTVICKIYYPFFTPILLSACLSIKYFLLFS